MHNQHFDDFENKSRSNMKYRIKRKNTNSHKKVTKSVPKLSNPQWENSYIDQVVAIIDTYLHCFS